MKVKGNIPDKASVCKMSDLHNDLIGGSVGFVVVTADFTAYHHLNQLILVGLCRLHSVHIAAVPEDFDVVGNIKQLIKFVGDVDDTNAGLFQPVNHLIEHLDFRVGKGRGRFVHDNNLCTERNGPDHLHHLLLSNGQLSQNLSGTDVHMIPIQQLLRLFVFLTEIHQTETAHLFLSHEDIFRNGDILSQHELLMDDPDTVFLTVICIVNVDLPALHINVS